MIRQKKMYNIYIYTNIKKNIQKTSKRKYNKKGGSGEHMSSDTHKRKTYKVIPD